MSLQGDSQKVVDYALRLQPFNGKHKSVAAANYIRSMHRANCPDEIKHLLETEDWLERDPNWAISLVVVKFDEKDYEQSEIYLRTAHAGDPQNWHTLRTSFKTAR